VANAQSGLTNIGNTMNIKYYMSDIYDWSR